MRISFSSIALCALTATLSSRADTSADSNHKRHLIDKYADSIILFEENHGQAPQGVEFVARGLGRRILIRPTGVQVFTPREISIGFAGANSAARGEARDAIAARSGFMWNGHVIALDNYKKV